MSKRFPDFAYENTRRIRVRDDYYDGATWVPVCPKCGRYVKADDLMKFKGDSISDEPNATCSQCGRVAMPFEGFL